MDISTLLENALAVPGGGAIAGLALAAAGILLLFNTKGRRRAPTLKRTLKAIRRAPIRTVPVLNKSERKVHRQLSEIVRQSRSYHLLAQVSMGEFLKVDGARTSRSKWQAVFNTFNAKRVDFLIVDANWKPCLAIEYQGTGHNQGNARARDAIKRAVVQRAGIPFIEVPASGLTDGQRIDMQKMLSTDYSQFAAE